MKRIALAVWFSLLAAGAAAEPVKCVDANGKTRYIDATMAAQEKCEPVKDSMSVINSPGPSSTPSPGARSTSSMQRDAREAQLAAAQASLAEAQKNLADQEALRSGNERNYARVLERLKPYQDAVDRAQEAVDKLLRDSR
jgi:HD superfamily phosphodiesterase